MHAPATVGSLGTHLPTSGASLHICVVGSAHAASSVVAIMIAAFAPVHDERSPWNTTSVAIVAMGEGPAGSAIAPASKKKSLRSRVRPWPKMVRGNPVVGTGDFGSASAKVTGSSLGAFGPSVPPGPVTRPGVLNAPTRPSPMYGRG